MEHRIVPGALVEHGGARWRVQRALGADAVLLRGGDGREVVADPACVTFPDDAATTRAAVCPIDDIHRTDADWAEAARRRDLLLQLAQQPDRTQADVDAVATKLGLKRRRIWELLRQVQASGGDIAGFLPARRSARAKRLPAAVEAVIAQAIDRHYAKPSRPSLLSLSREVDKRCAANALPPPSYKAVQARVQARDQHWLARRRHGEGKARSMRLLTGAHPGAAAPWARVQIDSTPATSGWCARPTAPSSAGPP